eukprot:TRINITY_DN11537_c0_g1_i1.p1 TRINITY_DN11537_c0_g1~~TRINITY_DN11537_c0_g1_i1.p1  ORF type:complete len:448 (+),score=128.63 TRINITY_DN11537_c0_g1_i1:115-1458(+)
MFKAKKKPVEAPVAEAVPGLPPIPPNGWQEKLDAMMAPVPEELMKPLPKSFYKEAETKEEKERSNRLREKLKKGNPFINFLLKAEEKIEEERQDYINKHRIPTRKEDAALWKKIPNVPGLYGGPPIPRKTMNNKEEVQEKFFDFFRQFQFGLWGYRQKPYPAVKPFDIQQVLGHKWLDWRYYDFANRAGNWYYKDRLGRTRGPCELLNLKTAWGTGIIDQNTFIWGDDMDEWAPIGMVYGLERAIATPDVKMAAMGTSVVHNLGRGQSPFAPLKGLEKKSYKQLQKEAVEKRDLENGILDRNDGVWPGEKIPTHALGMWAGGSELTLLLNAGEDGVLPNKFITYEMRKRLAKEIPGLRPWEVQDVDQVLDFVTYGDDWWREPMGNYTMRHEYEEDMQNDLDEKLSHARQHLREVLDNQEEAKGRMIEEQEKKKRDRRGKGSRKKPLK